MQTQTSYVYARQQFDALTPEQKQVLDAVAEYLVGFTIAQEAHLSDESLTEAFNLLKPCPGCVPAEEVDDDLLVIIRKKFGAVYQIALNLAELELANQGFKSFDHFHFYLVIEPCSADYTHVAVLDYKRPTCCYLHEWSKAWHFHFATLVELANEVLRIKQHLVEQVVTATRPSPQFHIIYVVMEGGLVHEVVNIPAGVQVQVLDYDVPGFERDQLATSPLNGKPCLINRFPDICSPS